MEMGINDFGEMTELCKMVKPQVAILTNIGPVHLEKLGSLDGVAKAKGELFQALPKEGTAVLNLDDPKIAELGQKLKCKKVTLSLKSGTDVTASVVRDYGPEGLQLNIHYGKDELDLRTPLVGVHNVYNLLCALGAAYALSIPKDKLQVGLNRFERPEMRLEVIKMPNNVSIVNDCYNANPASTMVALEVVRNMAPGRTIAVLGDMLELGDFSARAHRDVGIRVAGHKYAYLMAIGRFAGDVRQGAIQGGMKDRAIQVFQSHSEVVDALERVIAPNDMILVKGSRGMKMEQITEPLKNRLKEVKG
jgi:UDP-N-acetylmuramoyl-tripeptide--D-alanyl-D-alanine ligase